MRADWDQAIAANSGVSLKEEPDNGSVTEHELMLIGDDPTSGEAKLNQAKPEAAEFIAKNTR